MWTRKLSSGMSHVGILDPADFEQAFIRALSNDNVITKLQKAICGQLQKEVGELREIIKGKDKRISELENKVAEFERKQDDYEQYSRRNSIRVSGIAQEDSENLEQKVLDVFNDVMKVTPPVTPDQIDRLHRVGRPKKDVEQQVLVKFATYRIRNKVFRSKKNLKRPATSTENGQEPGEERIKRIFINEDLTSHRSSLLWNARKMKRDGKIQDYWSWDGQILIKNKVARIIPIRSLNELISECD